jgi:hypothetical protein
LESLLFMTQQQTKHHFNCICLTLNANTLQIFGTTFDWSQRYSETIQKKMEIFLDIVLLFFDDCLNIERMQLS